MFHSRWLDALRARTFDPLVVAHRGDSFRAPENTLEAAKLAYQSGAFAWELDVHLSLEGVPVVIHDESLLRTTDVAARFAGDPRSHRGFPVSRFSIEELKRLDAGSWFVSKTGGPRSAFGFGSVDRVPLEIVEQCQGGMVRIPTLREALVATKDWDWWVNVEIKSFPNPREQIAKIVVSEIENLAMSDRVLISSFNHGDVAEVRRSAPTIATGLLVDQPLVDPERYLREIADADCFHTSSQALGSASDRYGDHPSSRSLARRPISGLLERHLPILVYTVNECGRDGLAAHLAELNVSALFTDDPQSLVALFRERRDQA